MELKKVLLVFCLCALLISTQAVLPKCCVTVSKNISNKMLKRVKYTAHQHDGICPIKALILYLDGKKVCAPLGLWKRLLGVRKRLLEVSKKMLEVRKKGKTPKQRRMN